MSLITKHLTTFLFATLIVASILRLYNLGNVPPALHGDEALTGYTSYSIMKTGKDLLGINNVISFNDLNRGGGTTYPSLLSWIMVPFIFVFGLEIYVDRLPSAILGIASIFILFLIVRELTKNNAIALFSAILMTINPWAIHISRQGLLQSIGLFTVLAGIYLFILGISRPKYLLASSIVLGFSLYAYDAPRIFVPLMLTVLTIVYWTQLRKVRKIMIFGFLIFFLFYGLFLYQYLFKSESREYSGNSIINIQKVTELVNVERDQTNAPLWVSSIFHNKITVIYKTVFTNYVDILSTNWLYVNGPANYQMSTGKQGQFYFFEVPFAVAGFYFLYKRSKRVFLILISWFLIAILPGALSTSSNPNRLSLAIPIPLIFSASGFYLALNSLKKMHNLKKYIISVAFGTVVIISISSYLFTYFWDYPNYASGFWAKQQNDAIKYSIENSNKYKSIYIDGTLVWAMQYAYFTKMEPQVFQKSATAPVNYKGVWMYKFDNIYIGNFADAVKDMHCASEFFPDNSLVITFGDSEVFPGEKPATKFFDPGKLRSVYKAIETKNTQTNTCFDQKLIKLETRIDNLQHAVI